MAIPQPSAKNEAWRSDMKEMLVGAGMLLGALIALGSVFELINPPILGYWEFMIMQAVAATVILALYWGDIRSDNCLIRNGFAAGNLATYAASAAITVFVKAVLALPN